MRIFCAILLLCLCSRLAEGQDNGLHPKSPQDTILVNAVVNGNDTIPYIALPEVLVLARMSRDMRRRMEQWNRLREAVYLTYPYAVTASRILRDVDSQLARMPNKRQQKIYLASKEKELKAEFGDKLENLSIYQGKILMKLIARQTGSNCYDIIQQLRGGFSARFWQTVAFFFGGNLKSNYDAQEDQDIEIIVKEIQANQGHYVYNYN
jgi:Domain of unknown function (DUF4294)